MVLQKQEYKENHDVSNHDVSSQHRVKVGRVSLEFPEVNQ